MQQSAPRQATRERAAVSENDAADSSVPRRRSGYIRRMSGSRVSWSLALALASVACGHGPAASDSDAGGGTGADSSGASGSTTGGATHASSTGGTGSTSHDGSTSHGGSTGAGTSTGAAVTETGGAGSSGGGATGPDGSSGTTGPPTMCPDGLYDLDGDGTCEYTCSKTADIDAVCDMVDEDCDGAPDDEVDLCASLEHCGACGNACSAAHAMTTCAAVGPPPCSKVNTSCKLASCVCNGPQDCWWDVDGFAGNGCEYPCFKSNAGTEVCDELDNDCDGQIDEGGVCP